MLEPLKPLEAIPITHGIRCIKIDPSAHYICFINSTVTEDFIIAFSQDPSNPLPAGTPIYCVDDIDKAVRIYEILDTKVIGSHG